MPTVYQPARVQLVQTYSLSLQERNRRATKLIPGKFLIAAVADDLQICNSQDAGLGWVLFDRGL
jgi:hypothetical protein